jgi:hypothetical protein
MTKHWGSARTSGERVSICRACGGGFIPPAHGDCCSERCVHYLAVASVPVLGDPIFCQRDEPIKCWGCEVSFMSRGLRFCPECYFKARPAPMHGREPAAKPLETHAIGPGVGVGLTPTRHDEPIDRPPARSLCNW